MISSNGSSFGESNFYNYSFGSIVAFEIARQLQVQGQEVPFLVLLDVPAFLNSQISLWERLQIHINNLSFLKWQEKVDYLMKWINLQIKQKITNKLGQSDKDATIYYWT